MVYSRHAVLEFPGAPPFERAAATDSPRHGRLLNERRDAERARGLPAAVVEGRRAAEAAGRRGRRRAVRRVALGRVYNGAVGPAAVVKRRVTSLDAFVGPRV